MLAEPPAGLSGVPLCTPFVLWFDASFRGKWAGLAAVLRGPPSATGTRPLVATWTAVEPSATSEKNEARACRGSLRFLSRSDPPGPRRAQVHGDHPRVMQVGGGTTWPRDARIREPVHEGATAAVAAGWHLTWDRIPRAANAETDALARAALASAAGPPGA